MRLGGRVALITGGGGGIGGACAVRMATEGADIVIADLAAEAGQKVAAEVEGRGRRALFVETDVSDAKQVQRVVQMGVNQFGKIDILVNAAGGSHGLGGPIREMTSEAWDRILNVNLKSVFLCSQAVLDSMAKERWGRIVNISSRAGFRGRPRSGAYGAAKAAIIGFARVLAAEVGEYGITVNNVAPGMVDTPMIDRPPWDTAEGRMAELRSVGVVMQPARLARPEEIVAAIMYFCGPDSEHTTGATLHVNGGSLMW